jgi:hypothetical protein
MTNGHKLFENNSTNKLSNVCKQFLVGKMTTIEPKKQIEF